MTQLSEECQCEADAVVGEGADAGYVEVDDLQFLVIPRFTARAENGGP